MKGRTMPNYDYKCKEGRRVFELFRRFNDYDKEIKCPSCGSDKAGTIFSVPQISGETVTGFGFKDKLLLSGPGNVKGTVMGRGLGRGPSDREGGRDESHNCL
jgi:putative FmdB family regulatory protein